MISPAGPSKVLLSRVRCVAHAGPGLPEAVRFVLTTDREPLHPGADGRQDLEVRSYSPSNLRLEHGTRAARKRQAFFAQGGLKKMLPDARRNMSAMLFKT